MSTEAVDNVVGKPLPDARKPASALALVPAAEKLSVGFLFHIKHLHECVEIVTWPLRASASWRLAVEFRTRMDPCFSRD